MLHPKEPSSSQTTLVCAAMILLFSQVGQPINLILQPVVPTVLGTIEFLLNPEVSQSYYNNHVVSTKMICTLTIYYHCTLKKVFYVVMIAVGSQVGLLCGLSEPSNSETEKSLKNVNHIYGH